MYTALRKTTTSREEIAEYLKRFRKYQDKKKWLDTQETFGLHRQIDRKFHRWKVIAPFIDYQWDADTAVMISYARYGYLLLAIDVFSHVVRTFPLHSTKGQETMSALQTFFRTEQKPKKLRTNKATEYRNKDVQRLLKQEKVTHVFTQNETQS